MTEHDFSGLWRSLYRYRSSSRGNEELEGEHTLQIHQKGATLVAESLPDSKSYVIMRLSLDDDVATGTWQEHTEETGHYKGAIYYGAVQLTVGQDKKSMSGKWVGFGKDMKVNIGPWELIYIGPDRDNNGKT